MAEHTETQWRITGQPGPILDKNGNVVVEFPYYRFIWTEAAMANHARRDIGEDTPEQNARGYVHRVKTGPHPWTEGPHLHTRTVTTTDWEDA